ncbi:MULTISPECIES: TnsA endonuclease N-terminal domain-containing protein [Pseudomonadaceae]|jgi:hypothetical protein|uniref:TnsA endonuclease N-terminal domain-containing protein n=1 Tax=Aquipseudomonas alcaligenes (strain ATCC 14909 / DSM 50342 / CCUG 1425 / JCM 20561 / NBRC 14159 / NCIMB 9945 / NCTC 10367 / 1577) TaxID=1215092 RepID=U2ZV81_AQUA1|nr:MULTISPECIES: TnsA endonuclease N-terminal domain-containing protein [Pseudomonas]MBV5674684.1 TnsA endonuclease N-terminal domain-containing protein [Pseudomonas aeruginosa]GAD65002.1 hypothetical protein PA6_060_00070 [Pseudomonas alcaligenes NBRC 14159]SUD19402.1 transposon Tn7-like transposase A [Pseudomonas alcaligenes]
MAGVKARRPTPENVARWIKAGYGQGEGARYKPFLYVRDVPSRGTSTMVNSRVTGRTHHYLSRQEYREHLLAEYDKSTIDIREQYALLPWEETYQTAQRLGIKPPLYPGTRTPQVMTTDLLLSKHRPDGIELVAVSVKLESDLTPRNLEKLLIEKIYWNDRGIHWRLATEKHRPEARVSNLDFFSLSLSQTFDSETFPSPEKFSRHFEENHRPNLTFNDILKTTASELKIDSSTAHSLLGKAIWNGSSRIDLDAGVINHRSKVRLK